MELKEQIDILEKKILEERLADLEEKLEKITRSRAKLIVKVEKDMKNLDRFFDMHIVTKKDGRVKTTDVLTKVNEFVLPLNLKFSKFEVSKFMLQKGVVRKKIGSYNYYLDIEIV